MPKYNKPRRTWKYSPEFKAIAVEMSSFDGVTSIDVAEKLDIHAYMLSRWRKEYREGRIVTDKRKRLTNTKKAATVSCGGAPERYKLTQRLESKIGIKFICEFSGVSRSGYYDWRKRKLPERTKTDSQLKPIIQSIYDDGKGAYGSPSTFKAQKSRAIPLGVSV